MAETHVGDEQQLLLRSADEGLIEEVRRLTPLLGVRLHVLDPAASLPESGLLLDDEAALPPGSVRLYTHSVTLQLHLPHEADRLLAHVAEEVRPPAARTVGVLGARGGVGASSFAAALARMAVQAGQATTLIDLDPGGGGIDVLLGLEHDPGPRWADVLGEEGGFPPERLRLALPAWHSVRVLSGDARSGARLGAPSVKAAVAALSRDGDLLVLDLPRAVLTGSGDGAWLLPACREIVLVAGCDVRSASAVVQAAELLRASSAPRLVLRTGSSGALPAEDVAAAAGLRAATMRGERSLDAGIERGVGPAEQRRGALAGTARQLLRDIGVVS